MHDGDVAVLDLEDHDLAYANGVILVIEEENVSALEGRLHGPRQHHHHGRLALSDEHKPLPDHERAEDDHCQVESLKSNSHDGQDKG